MTKIVVGETTGGVLFVGEYNDKENVIKNALKVVMIPDPVQKKIAIKLEPFCSPFNRDPQNILVKNALVIVSAPDPLVKLYYQERSGIIPGTIQDIKNLEKEVKKDA